MVIHSSLEKFLQGVTLMISTVLCLMSTSSHHEGNTSNKMRTKKIITVLGKLLPLIGPKLSLEKFCTPLFVRLSWLLTAFECLLNKHITVKGYDISNIQLQTKR